MMRVMLPAATFFGIAVGVCAALAVALIAIALYEKGRKS